ncbi:Tandem-95 repeat protein [Sulfidibacter corallicola]|uniref:Tandem-95 repeat protein n=1 Tax=Sulfidibacter corallicola TaxID=2818388 RepID=A0A8A4TRP9_SULCO|nr:Ig-like domain-containing protein [Sulfidibacter corallicola]QTD51752.1 tandem-95 repeat protein [Sulfidibacter corallicola]
MLFSERLSRLPVTTMFWLFFGSSAFVQAQVSHSFEVGIDNDNNPETGCQYTMADGVVVEGIELIATVTVRSDVTPASVTEVTVQTCEVSGTFGAPRVVSSGSWPVAGDQGASGTDVIEAMVPAVYMGITTEARLVYQSRSFGGDFDVLRTTDGSGAGNAIIYQFAAPIPTLGEWMLILYIGLFTLLALYLLRRRKRLGPGGGALMIFLAMLLMGPGIAIILDGNLDDWAGVPAIGIDPLGDTDQDDPSADLGAVYACDINGNLFLRLDVGELENLAPNGVDDTATVDEDDTVNIAVLANDDDGDGGAPGANVTLDGIETQASNGNAVAEADGTVTYTPDADFAGVDTFVYRLADDLGLTATATVTVTVDPVPDPPTAVADNATTPEEVQVDIDVTANDVDPDAGDTLTVISVDNGANGTASIVANMVRYVPDLNFNGDDTFNYTIQDSTGNMSSAAITVTVSPVNDQPQAVDDAANTNEDNGLDIDVLSNDIKLDAGNGDSLLVLDVTLPANGSSAVNPDQTVNYTPNADFNGVDSFTYTIRDEEGLTDTATVTVTVDPVNDPPTAGDDNAATVEDTDVTVSVLNNDSDPDTGDTLTVTGAGNGTNGTTVFDGTSVTYTPNPAFVGNDSFTYTIEDGSGAPATATVSIAVNADQAEPIAVDIDVETEEGEPVVIRPLDGLFPGDNGPLFLVSTSQPAEGSASLIIDPAGTATQPDAILYQPFETFTGVETFTYTVSDQVGNTASANINMTVVAKNSAPVASPDIAQTEADTAVSIDVLANDRDPDGDALEVVFATDGVNGSVVVNPDDTVTYTPDSGFEGLDQFAYTVRDPGNLGDTVLVSVDVVGPGEADVAIDDSATTPEDTPIEVFVLANDGDGGGPLSIQSVTQPTNGSVIINAGNTTVTYTPDPNFDGDGDGSTVDDLFSYTLAGSRGGSPLTATVSVFIIPRIDPPNAVDDNPNVDEDSSTPIDILANDSDPEGGATLTVTEVTQAITGATTLNPDQTVTYTPPADFNGSDLFSYTIENEAGLRRSAVVLVTVDPVNDPPTANDDAETVLEAGTDYPIDVLANDDIAPDTGETLTITAVGTPDNGGSAVIAAGGTRIDYTPETSFVGTETFTYTIDDGSGAANATDTATVTITVTPLNIPPDAVDDAETVAEDSTTTTFTVLANDTTAPDVGETLTITAVGATDNGGTAVISGGGTTIDYTPAADFFGTETFTYTVDDGSGAANATDTATVTVTVTGENDPPVAVDDTPGAVDEDSADNNIDVLANDDIAPDTGETLTITAVGATNNGGTATIAGGGTSINYTPAADFFGTETFTYTIDDGSGAPNATATATVTMTVTNTNDPPVAVDDTPAVAEDSSANALDVLANDSFAPDTGETLTITAVGATDNGGTAVISGGGTMIDYTPAANFAGTETFTYTIDDGSGAPNATDTATVTVMVSGDNDPPDAVDDAETVAEDATTQTFTVLANDTTAPDMGETLTITAVGATNNGGTAVISGGGTTIDYTPAADFNGTETFTYTVDDGSGAPNATDTATVTVTVTAENDPPDAVDDAETVAEDATTQTFSVLTNDSFAPDTGETLTITAVGATDNGGTAVISGGGTTIDYTPAADFNGTETFTYTIDDGSGAGNATDTATVTVTVTAENDPPDAVDDAETVAEDATTQTFSVLTNDSFAPDTGETLTITAVGATDNGGTAVISGGGTTIDYTPAADFNGTETFTYTIDDGSGAGNATDTATVTVTVTAENDPPDAVDDAETVAEDATTQTFSVLTNDSFAPDTGETLTITAVGATNNGGTAVISGGGTTIDYTPAANFNGTETFTYTIDDGSGAGNATDTATVTVTVTAENDPPDAVDDGETVAEDATTQTFSVLTNDSFAPDTGETLTITAVGATNNGGTAVISGGGTTIDYTPAANFFGTEIFTYTIDDGSGAGNATDTATVTVTVTGTNDPPNAMDDGFMVAEDSLTGPLSVLTNDSILPDTGETLTITGVGATSNGGTAVISGGGTTIDYTPAPNFFGTETFTYTIDDGSGAGNATDTATVTVTVTNTNDPPDAMNDSETVDENSAATTFMVLANDSILPDVGETLTITAVGVPNNGGSAVITGGGTTIDYAPAMSFTGTETFTYTIDDGSGAGNATDTATVTVTVSPLNDPPVADDEAYTVIGNTLFHVNSAGDIGAPPTGEAVFESTLADVLDGDTDPNGHNLSATVETITTTNGGSVDMRADGSFAYRPPAGFTTDSFTYTVNDDGVPSMSDTGTVTITMQDMIWFFDDSNTDPTPTGTSSNPFNSAQDLTAAPFAAGHILFIHTGTSTTPGNEIDGLFEPQANTAIVGEGVVLEVSHPEIGGNATLRTAGTHPVITNSTDDTIRINDVDGVSVRGLTVNNTSDNAVEVVAATGALGFTFSDNAVGSATNQGIRIVNNATGDLTLTASNNTISSTGDGLNASLTSSGNLRVSLDNNTDITSGGSGIVLDGTGGAGTVFVHSFDSNTVHQDTVDEGIIINEATFDTDDATPFVAVTGGSTRIGTTGDGVGGGGLILLNVTGSLSFTDLDIETNNTGLTVLGSGVYVPDTSGFLLTTAGGTIVATSVAVDLDPMTAAMTLDSVTTTGGNNGISLEDVAGTVQINGGSISGTTGTAFAVNRGDADVTYQGGITNTTNRLLTVTDTTGGTVTLSTGTLSDTGGSGIQLSGVAGDVTVSATTTIGNSTSSGIDIQGGTGTFSFSNTTITNPTGVALNVDGGGGGSTASVTFGGSITKNNAGLAIDINNVDTGGSVDINTTTLDIDNGSGIQITDTDVTVGIDNADIDNTSTGIDLSNNTGTFTFSGLNIAGTTTAGVLVNTGSGSVNYTGPIANASGRLVDIQNTTGGTHTFSGGTLTGAGTGILLGSNAGTTTNFNGNVDLLGFTVLPLSIATSATSTVHFANLDVTTTGANGIDISNLGTFTVTTGTVGATTGSAIQLNTVGIGAGGVTFTTIASSSSGATPGVSLNTVTGAGTFGASTSVTVNGTTGGAGGIDIRSSSAAVSLTGLDVDNTSGAGVFADSNTGNISLLGAGSDISGATGPAFDINNGQADFSYAGTVTTNTASLLVDITNNQSGTLSFSNTLNSSGGGQGINLGSNSGGTLTFSGAVTLNTGTNTGINATSNTGFSMNFTGNLDVDTTTGIGVTATGGGTLSINGGTNSVTVGAATAVNISNTTIGGNGSTGGIVVRDISSNGGATGIALNNTGVGRFVVTGTATTDGTGGTIQNKAGRGAEFLTAQNITLSNMTFTNNATTDAVGGCGNDGTGNANCNAALHFGTVTGVTLTNVDVDNNGGQYGINGNDVTDFVMTNSIVEDVGNGVNEHAVRFADLKGTCNLDGNTIRNSDRFLVYIHNDGTSALTSLTLNNNTLTNSANESAFRFRSIGTSSATLNLTGNTITNNFSGAIVADAFGSSTMDITVSGHTATGNTDFVQITSNESADVTYDVLNNTNVNNTGGGITCNLGDSSTVTGSLSGFVRNNVVVVTGGATSSPAIRVVANGAGTHNATIDNNNVSFNSADVVSTMFIASRDGSCTLNATVTNNTVAMTAAFGLHAIQADCGVTNADTTTLCLDMRGNTATNTNGLQAIRTRQRGTNSIYQLESLSPVNGSNAAAVEGYHATRNPATNAADIDVRTSGTDTVVNYTHSAGCTEPTP